MSKSTVVVIGSGPGPSNMSGSDIDRHPVVRMWNHDWQPADRYGSRYDYGLISALDYAHLATRIPSKSWFLYTHKNTVKNVNGVCVSVLNHKQWFEKAAAHGAVPGSPDRALKFTRGFAAVAGAIQCLHPRRVIVIGMSILRDGETGLKYYDPAALPFYVNAYPAMAVRLKDWAADTMPPGLRGEGPHDYFAEAKVIRELAAEAGTEIVWE